MTKEGTLMVVDDNRSILSAVELLMGRYFERVITLNSPNRIVSTIESRQIDVVLLDMNFSSSINTGNEGLYWLEQIKSRNENTEVVVFTAYAEIDLAVEAIKRGAADFVVKPWENDRLVAALQNAYALSRQHRKVRQLKQISNQLIEQTSNMYWGESQPMRLLHDMVDRVADTDANILITGENGTGKELLAREIHLHSKRKHELMVTVDMGALTETLFESELFGHAKGAFTDAKEDRAGKFEVADRGTLFMDEIGNLPLHLQAKLLGVLQSQRVVRVGSNESIPVDIRLISATNRDVEQMVGEGTFREDLLYRLNTIHLTLPPLRQRREDIVPLANRFLATYAAKYNKSIDGFDSQAQKAMSEYGWNGNIRELQHTIEKAVIMNDKGKIGVSDLLLKAQTAPLPQNLNTLEQMEQEMIRVAMANNTNNMKAVAEQLGITRQTLYNKIKKFGL